MDIIVYIIFFFFASDYPDPVGKYPFSILIMYTFYPHIHIFSKNPASLDFRDFFENLAISICAILCYTFTCFKEYINR